MIDINIEFTKGILFVRLIGILNKSNEEMVQEKIFDIVKDGGIRFVVFNINDLDVEDDVELFDKCEELIINNDGKMLLCGDNNNVFACSFDFVSDELSALKLLTA